MQAAREAGRILVSANTDFGELLTLGSHASPSIVLLRRSPHGAEAQVHLLLAGLDVMADDLANGAIVVLTPTKTACPVAADYA